MSMLGRMWAVYGGLGVLLPRTQKQTDPLMGQTAPQRRLMVS